MSESIENKVVNLVSKHLNVEEGKITPESRIVEDLGADSLDTLELMMNFEQEFGCTIPEEDARKILTISNLIEYISNLEKNKVE